MPCRTALVLALLAASASAFADTPATDAAAAKAAAKEAAKEAAKDGVSMADIRTFINLHNQNPKPFKWTKSADQILASVKRFCHKAQQTLCGEL